MDPWIGTLFVIVMAVVSRVFYLDNKYSKKRHEHSQAIPSQPSFKVIYVYIKATTIIVSPLCFFMDHTYLFEWHHSREIFYYGISVASLGMGLFIMSKLNLGHNYNPCFDAYLPRDVVQTGVYKFIRHPIYTANILTMAGAALATGSFWLLGNLTLLSYYYYRASLLEEHALSEAFPGYLSYKETTGAFLPNLTEMYKNGFVIPNTEDYWISDLSEKLNYSFDYNLEEVPKDNNSQDKDQKPKMSW